MSNRDVTYDGAVVSICATPQSNRNLNLAGFEALTFLPISKVVTVPGFRVDQSTVTQNYVNELGIHMTGGGAGIETSIVIGPDYNTATNAGQAALRTASGYDNRQWYAMKIERADSPNTATTTNTIEYAIVLVKPGGPDGGDVGTSIIETYPILVQGFPVTAPPEAV
jgi:hypothetical protein